MLSTSYDSSLVSLSFMVAILTSYTALNLAGRINSLQEKNIFGWLVGGALVMGVGIWSMHFIGMLAFQLPIPLAYDFKISALSLVIAVLASGFALWQINQPHLPVTHLSISAVIMGSAIAAMHYTGMAALRMTPGIEYDRFLFGTSIVIAVFASGAALWIAFKLRKDARHTKTFRALASIIMGGAIVGMHYTGMAAANFPIGSVCSAVADGIKPGQLTVLVIVTTLAVLAFASALLTSALDEKLETQTEKLARSLADANSELTKQTLHDNLTKLANRRFLEERLKQMLSNATREGSRFAIMFLDLDGFKTVNDSLGHHTGDLLLIEVAARIRNNLREQDIVARLGGDEFVILIEINDLEDAASVANKLVIAINQPVQINEYDFCISSSIGIAVFPENGVTEHDLLVNADAAMYHTKHTGRAGYRFFESSMNANAHNQLQFIQDLRNALKLGEFYLDYQPKFHAQNGSIVGAEALLRWKHPTRGIIEPDDFVPIATKTGLIDTIGEWVLDEACRQMREWHDVGYSTWKISVNLSASQFRQTNLVEFVAATLIGRSLPPGCLILEVKESATMHNIEASLLILKKLAELGVEISIDDFGSAYSSLRYLKHMPASELKIDRDFIRELAYGTNDAAIVAAIISLGHSLNLRIVGKGVETTNQQDCLTSLGCDVLQGYLMGRPMSPLQFLKEENAMSASKIA
ncbi:putative bifunctional diguanylate cyclase/phosphodiesterase [Herminiimonas fonticola]|uniref:Diguanylate cyclase (GGDEF)-like protein n=1 Tax=Herminiimonas fonticola TaxID=303380 RepID=A0A4R6G648_9BURK|nr:bifunctional diguanylate cyclase/phosphodiesterase [Herminiimonas fonticola]RBA23956.1 GGDEF: diguanylate cyclase (GGDEF) domain [Herminiimonas fonticola]TDN89956.1 diguanylate cyclase (GGDEF)-like protein [Herminiimonas fonticola]